MWLVCVFVCIAGCASTHDNPKKMLKYAHYNIENSVQPESTQRFLDEAYAQFKEDDDLKGMAETHYLYGLFHKKNFYVPAVDSLAKGYNLESSVALDVGYKDYNKSIGHFKRAIAQFERLDDFEGLTRAYFCLGSVYTLLNNNVEALRAYDISEEWYQRMRVHAPKTRLLLVSHNGLFPVMLEQCRSREKRKLLQN